MIRSACLAAAALAAASLPSATAAQATADSHHQATQRVALADWVQRVEAELARKLAFRTMNGREPESGVVRIKFNCSEDGRADKVSVLRSSGSRMLDIAAAKAVKRIAVMHPLATGINTDQIYYADILFAAGNDEYYQRRMASLQDGAMRNNGWFKAPDDNVIASR
jgi:TonB family protein